MSGAQAQMLAGGRLHLSHGPIDLVIGAEGDAEGDKGAREAAFGAARACFDGLLEALVAELTALRRPLDGTVFQGPVARRMAGAVAPHRGFVTPMAAVAGAVADEVLAAMCAAAPLARAYVNNGGDIALHLAPGATYLAAMAASGAQALGQVEVTADSPVRGIASSGRAGRSLSLGIADSVTVLAADGARADVAATLIANAVDLPGHAAITRRPARDLQPDSDLGARLVVTARGALRPSEVARALERGARRAQQMQARGLIHGAALFLDNQARVVSARNREVAHA